MPDAGHLSLPWGSSHARRRAPLSPIGTHLCQTRGTSVSRGAPHARLGALLSPAPSAHPGPPTPGWRVYSGPGKNMGT